MNYCYQCGHITPGEPAYCNFCGRSYDVRLCARGHQNPRGAEVCSQCGSRELSTPQPRIPLRWKLLAIILRIGLGVLLLYLSLALMIGVLETPQFQRLLVITGVLLGSLWWCYTQLPEWLREFIRWLVERRNDGD